MKIIGLDFGQEKMKRRWWCLVSVAVTSPAKACCSLWLLLHLLSPKQSRQQHHSIIHWAIPAPLASGSWVAKPCLGYSQGTDVLKLWGLSINQCISKKQPAGCSAWGAVETPD